MINKKKSGESTELRFEGGGIIKDLASALICLGINNRTNQGKWNSFLFDSPPATCPLDPSPARHQWKQASPLCWFGEECISIAKDSIQPQVPLRLPCYDFTPVEDPTVVCANKTTKRLCGTSGTQKSWVIIGPFDIQKLLSNSWTGGECWGEPEKFG
ncbi:hypothetical protein V6N13_053800 [Hibiscus sabdariffa]|uniref:Uncharacterized protein n=1 Tax=Hibiscus sabdariffa TaxID=183260 RepID=A0ABR2T6J0_9ROSI